MPNSRENPIARVLGIDPGFGRCGAAILEGGRSEQKLLFSSCITTSSKDPQEERLRILGEALQQIIRKWKPKALAIEKLFFNANVNTALRVAEARGVILYEAGKADIKVYEYSPQDVKAALTGYGRAGKAQVEEMALKILRLKKGPKYDDEADAIAVGITHLASRVSI